MLRPRTFANRKKGILNHLFSFEKFDYLAIFLLSLHVLFWFQGDLLWIGGDFGFPMNQYLPYVWYQLDCGYLTTTSSLPLSAFFAFLRVLGLSLSAIEKVYFTVLTFLAAASMYYLTSVLLNSSHYRRYAALTSSIIYMFNPYLFVSLIFLPMYAVLPLMLAVYVKGLRGEGLVQNALIFALSSVLISHPLIANYRWVVFAAITLVLYTAIHAFVDRLDVRHLIRFLPLCTAFSVLTNLFWILPASQYSTQLLSVAELGLQTVPIIFFGGATSTLVEATRWLGQWAFYSTNPLYFSFAPIYIENPIMMGITFIMPIMAFGAFLLRPKDKNVIFFTALTLLGLFLAKGVNPPLGWLYEWAVLNISVLRVFRESFRWMALVTLGYSFLIGFTCAEIYDRLSHPKKRLRSYAVACLFLSLIFINSWPLVTGDVLNFWHDPSQRGVEIPEYYWNAEDWFSSDHDEFRVFVLPRRGTYIGHSWGYQGGDISQDIFTKPMIVGRAWRKPYSKELIDQTFDAFYENKTTAFRNALVLLNVKYILVERCLITEPSADRDIGLLEFYNDIESVKQFGELLVYENLNFVPRIYSVGNVSLIDGSLDNVTNVIDQENFNPHTSAVIFTNQLSSEQLSEIRSLLTSKRLHLPQITFEKLNPTKFIAHVEVGGPFLLVFSESFDSNWKAYADGSEITNHFAVNYYANGWLVNKAGSYDIVLECRPQRLLEGGELVSLTTVLLGVCLIASLQIKRRNVGGEFPEGKQEDKHRERSLQLADPCR